MSESLSCKRSVDQWHKPITIVHIAAGTDKEPWARQVLDEAASRESQVFLINCDFDEGGPWAGIRPLFSDIFLGLEEQRPDLVEKHLVELVYVLPWLRRKYEVKHRNLTDLAPREEKSRFFAADRAYRVLQGLIDLIAAWKAHTERERRWIIVCDSYDRAGHIATRFFRELYRRLSITHSISLWVVVSNEETKGLPEEFFLNEAPCILRPDLQTKLPRLIDCSHASKQALTLEETAKGDRIEIQLHLPELIRLWQEADRPDKVLYYRHLALETYNTLGLYADALRFGDGLLEDAKKYVVDEIRLQWSIIVKRLMCYMGLGQAEEGLELALGPALEVAGNGERVWQGRLSYLIAMFYARYSKPRNYEKGIEWLNRGLQEIAEAGLPEHEFHFESVFNRNGLAMIRSFQGHHAEAIALCSEGLARLNQYLSAEKHLLHRSILVYNIAQVYASMKRPEDALRSYSAVIEMDPNYSEYYNERGNLYLAEGRIDEALQDYLKAVQLSSPYFEVHTNLGQCYRRMGRYEDAIREYSRSLDLEPNHQLALIGRAQAYDEMQNPLAAIADYSATLKLDPGQWNVLANRGVLFYQLGNHDASLADLDAAIHLHPTNADLYSNRSFLLDRLGRGLDAIHDLEKAIELSSPQESCEEMRVSLEALRQKERNTALRSTASGSVFVGN